MKKKLLYASKLLLFALYGILLYVTGFTLTTWAFWAMVILVTSISCISYVEGSS